MLKPLVFTINADTNSGSANQNRDSSLDGPGREPDRSQTASEKTMVLESMLARNLANGITVSPVMIRGYSLDEFRRVAAGTLNMVECAGAHCFANGATGPHLPDVNTEKCFGRCGLTARLYSGTAPATLSGGDGPDEPVIPGLQVYVPSNTQELTAALSKASSFVLNHAGSGVALVIYPTDGDAEMTARASYLYTTMSTQQSLAHVRSSVVGLWFGRVQVCKRISLGIAASSANLLSAQQLDTMAGMMPSLGTGATARSTVPFGAEPNNVPLAQPAPRPSERPVEETRPQAPALPPVPPPEPPAPQSPAPIVTPPPAATPTVPLLPPAGESTAPTEGTPNPPTAGNPGVGGESL